MELRRLLLIICIAVGLGLVAVAWFFPVNEDFRVENPFWNGCRDIEQDATAEILVSLDGLPELPPESTVILVPYTEFNTAELDGLESFITGGGRLVLADDYGQGNQVLEHLGLPARFSGQPMLDPLHNYKNKWLPVIYNFTEHDIMQDMSRLTLNHPTCLENVDRDDVLAYSSSFSFLDANENEKWDNREVTGPLAMMSHHVLGEGTVVLVSDPSVFINSMEGMEGNRQLLVNLAKSGGGKLVIDQSHLPPSNLTETKSVLTVVRESIRKPFHALGAIAFAVIIITVPVWRGRNSRKEEKGERVSRA